MIYRLDRGGARRILRKTRKSKTGQRKYLQIGKSLFDGLIIGTIARPINLCEKHNRHEDDAKRFKCNVYR